MCCRAAAENSAPPAVIPENIASNPAVEASPSHQMLTLCFPGGVAPGTGRQVNEWRDDGGEVFARAFSLDNRYWIEWPGLGVFGFAAGSNEVQVWPEHDAPQADILETFSRRLQPVILQALGWQSLHAAAAVGLSGVIAFCGRAGSGKSTLGFALQQAGYQHLADDALVLRLDQDRVSACPIPFAPRLRPTSQNYLGYAGENQPPPVEAQSGELPLSAVFLLRQAANIEESRLSLLPQAQAFSELLAHAHCYDARDPQQLQRLVDDYLAIVARVPVFTLQYRPGLQQLPQLIEMVVEGTGNTNASAEFRATTLVP